MNTPSMPFTKWVDTHVTDQRAPRLQAIMTMLETDGPLTSHDVQDHLARACARTHMHPREGAYGRARLRVTIDTIQRDLALLIERGYLQRVDMGDSYEWGAGRRLRISRYGLPTAAL